MMKIHSASKVPITVLLISNPIIKKSGEFVDENGELPAEASKDGVHLRGDWCKQWLAYLQTHTVDYDTLYPDGAPAAEAPAPEISENGSASS